MLWFYLLVSFIKYSNTNVLCCQVVNNLLLYYNICPDSSQVDISIMLLYNMKQFEISGYVYGKYWGGGSGAYPATKISGSNLTKLLRKAKEMLSNGSLDSGMGYESLLGAYLSIKTEDTITLKGREFVNTDYDDKFIGRLTRKEKNFLIGVSYNQ